MLNLDDLLANIGEVLSEADGQRVVELYNSVCSNKIRYVGDSLWEHTGEEDSEEAE